MIAYKLSSILVQEKKEKNIKMIQTELCFFYKSCNSMTLESRNTVPRRCCFYFSGLTALNYDRGSKNGIAANAMLLPCFQSIWLYFPEDPMVTRAGDLK